MTNKPFMDDMSRMFGGAMQNFGALKQEMENMIMHQMQGMFQKMDLVTREEFEAMKEMLQKIDNRQEDIVKRLEAMEGKQNTATGTKKSSAKKS